MKYNQKNVEILRKRMQNGASVSTQEFQKEAEGYLAMLDLVEYLYDSEHRNYDESDFEAPHIFPAVKKAWEYLSK